MLITLIRTVIIYFFLVLTVRLLGKRQIGELEPAELVVTIVISEVAALPIQDTSQPLASSLAAIVLLLILEVVLSFSAYKSFSARKVFFGLPSVFYEKGRLNRREMEKQRLNLNDLMEIVRNSGASSLSEVDFVIMETNGAVSVIPSAPHRNVTVSDAGLDAKDAFISYVIIDDGKINRHNLSRLGFGDEWLKGVLRRHGIRDAASVSCLTADISGETVVIPNEKMKKRRKV